MATTAALSLLPEEPRYPQLGAYTNYGEFTLPFGTQSRESRYKSDSLEDVNFETPPII
jgi:hypothetical protein